MADGLLGGLSEQDRWLALLSAGAGLLGGAVNRGGYFGPALQQGVQSGLGTAQGLNQARLSQRQADIMETYRRGQEELQRAQLTEMQRRQQTLGKREGIFGRIGQPASLAPTVENVAQGPRPFGIEDALSALISAGDIEGAKELQAVGPQYDIRQDESGRLVYVPKRPGAPMQPTGIGAYRPELDPAMRSARIEDRVRQEQAIRALGPSPQAATIVTDVEGNQYFVDPRNPSAMATPVRGPGGAQLAKPIPGEKTPTDAERASAGYANRMIAGESIIERVGASGEPTAVTQASGAIPLVGRYAQSAAMTPEQQMFRQAQEDWVRAKLRKESGAVIGAEEMRDEIRTYFPQPLDDPRTIAQKVDSRRIATEAMLLQAGRARPRAPEASQPTPAQNPLSKEEEAELRQLRGRFGRAK